MGNDKKDSNEDEFWEVAMMPTTPTPFDDDEEDENDTTRSSEESSNATMTSSKPLYFQLPYHMSDQQVLFIDFKLYPLLSVNGVMGPLGSNPWYSSALLSMIFLQTKPSTLAHRFIQKFTETSFHALELGSGAVGLASVALSLLLSKETKVQSRIVSSDYHTSIVENLRTNLQNFQYFMQQKHPSVHLPELHAVKLDWSFPEAFLVENPNYSFDFIFGSELVYTHATADACANCILKLLRLNPHALVVIVQVSDRDGYLNRFLPRLEESGCRVLQEQPIHADLHSDAQKLLPCGGVLDPFAFCLTYICMDLGYIESIAS